jgi:serine/threonine-protein kinase
MTDSTDRSLAVRLAQALGGEYTIEGEIGRGGMGVVYRARDERLHRRVAIKVLPPELAFQKDIRERFTREAQTAAKLSHPHIVPIHDVGEGEGLVYFVMGYVDGESVGGRLKRRGPLPVEEARRIMKETADALSAAHALSVIHRDIKPDNILLEGTRGRVMVTDFGIAKALSAASGATLTGAGIAIGTPSYMSPEQAAGEREIDGRSDLYSLGIVAYQMLTGELPFSAPTVAGILMKQITEPAPMVTSQRHDVPEDLSLAVSRCLEKDPANRWPTADALRRSLESRTVTGYRPTGTAWRAGTGRSTSGRPAEPARSPRTAGSRSPRPLADRGALARRDPEEWRDRKLRRRHGPWTPDRDADERTPLPDTGEPKIVQTVRAQFARWAAINGGLFLLNVATTQLDPPWFLFPAAGMGFGLLSNYAKLWQAGYSWRDVLNRPPAHDAVTPPAGARKGAPVPKQLPAPTAADFGGYRKPMEDVQRDRAFIIRQLEQLPAEERELLPDVMQTTEALYERAASLAGALHAMDSGMDTGEVAAIETEVARVRQEPDDAERERRLGLLERKRKSLVELRSRREQVQRHFESCVYAMQNVRYDLLRLKSAGVGAVLGDLTQATQQARALSRDVDGAIAAAAEIREIVR